MVQKNLLDYATSEEIKSFILESMDINDEEYSMTVKSIYEYISKSDKMYYLEISETNNYIRNDFEATKKNEFNQLE